VQVCAMAVYIDRCLFCVSVNIEVYWILIGMYILIWMLVYWISIGMYILIWMLVYIVFIRY